MEDSVPFLVTFLYIIVPVVSLVLTGVLLKWTKKKEADKQT
ncbi:hypothetical protein [Thalassobacillus devorans]|nr:hypothetical protein [Thalassobacillus devorans]